MIEESYVSFETAKMLKEAGFDVPCRGGYHVNRFRYEAPTQALAARWLCERKMIEVSVAYCRRRKSWYYWVGSLDCKDEDVIFGFDYASRQYALEAGLKHGLELVKK